MKTYFYIIQRNGQIFEVEHSQDRFKGTLEQWQKGGLIVFPTIGVAVNSVDITNILNTEQYENFIDSSQPKLFIRNGTWYDIKERKPVRHEKWKQEEVDSRLKLDAGEAKPLLRDLPADKLHKFFEENAPDFIKEKRKLLQEKVDKDY